MILGIITSVIAIIAYGYLLIPVSQKELRGSQPESIFFIYLLDMMLLQAAYLGISIAQNEQQALLWYTLQMSLASAQIVIYFFFIRKFLGLELPCKLTLVSISVWFLSAGIGIVFRSSVITNIYRDPATGLLVPEFGPMAITLFIPTLIFLGATLFNLVSNYRGKSRSQQARIQYLLLAIIMVWAGMATNTMPALRRYPIDVIANILSAFMIAYAILRYQLLEISTALRKGSEFFISLTVISIGSTIVIFLFTNIAHVWFESNILFLAAIIAAITLMVLIPLRDRIQQQIGHTLFKTTYDGYLMVQRLSHTATSILNLKKLSDMILVDVVSTLRARWGVLLLKQDGDDFQPVAWEGITENSLFTLNQNHPILNWLSKHETVIVPYSLNEALEKNAFSKQQLDDLKLTGSELFILLRTRGQLIGILCLGAKLSHRPYSQDDELTLVTVANNISSAIDNARLYEAIQVELKVRKRAEEDLQKANEMLQVRLDEIQVLQENLRELAIRDSLTGLYNRRYLDETMERELARAKRENYPVSVMMIDIDHFKDFNDAHGHQAGDEVLTALGALLRHSVRQSDIACRYGGEEFIVIMPGVDKVDTERRAETIRHDFGRLCINYGQVELRSSISVGVAFYPQHGGDINKIIKVADAALYEAKQAGRDRVHVWRSVP